MSEYEHDSTGLLAGWPQRVLLQNGVEVDSLLLATITRRAKSRFPAWTLQEMLHEVYAIAVKLSGTYDPTKGAKFESYLYSWAAKQLTRVYDRQYRMRGCGENRRGEGWIRAVGDGVLYDRYLDGDSADAAELIFDRVQQHEDPEPTWCYGEVLDELCVDLTDEEQAAVQGRLLGVSDQNLSKSWGRGRSTVWIRYRSAKKKMLRTAAELGITNERLW